MTNYLFPLAGGALIGLAVSLMLLWNGRITGVSGIVNGVLSPGRDGFFWRFSFIIGLLAGGILLKGFAAETVSSVLERSTFELSAAGLLVGFGTVMGNGCTSGHGICGLSRLSPRSIAATLAFIGFGILSVTIIRRISETT